MMSTRTTLILFGTTNPYLANFGPFNRRTRIAQSVEYMTRDEASQRLMTYCEQESDNHVFGPSGMWVECDCMVIMQHGDLSYEHDGRTWEFIALPDLTEEDARIALRDNVLSDKEAEEVYQLHPDLRPEENPDEDNA